jgi:hypothetical protein
MGTERGKGSERSPEPRAVRMPDGTVAKKSVRMPGGVVVKKSVRMPGGVVAKRFVRMPDGTVVRTSVRMPYGIVAKKSVGLPYKGTFKKFVHVSKEGVRKQTRKRPSAWLPLVVETMPKDQTEFSFQIMGPTCNCGLEDQWIVGRSVDLPTSSFHAAPEEMPTEAANLAITLIPTKNWSSSSRKDYEQESPNDSDTSAADSSS